MPPIIQDFEDIFARYEALVAAVDKTFEAVKARHGKEVTCAKGCSDCCSAVFDLSLVEALYLNQRFNTALDTEATQPARQAVLRRADVAERQQAKLARAAHKELRQGLDDEAILTEAASRRIRCPLLAEDDSCDLYAARPITCRLYGVPQNIRGQARTCGMSGFEPGRQYPTVNVERIQDLLVELSEEISQRLQSRYRGLTTMHMPVASALLTTFDDEFFKAGSKAAMAMEPDMLPDMLSGMLDDDTPVEIPVSMMPDEGDIWGPAPSAPAAPDAQGAGCGGGCGGGPKEFTGRPQEFKPQGGGCTPADCAACGSASPCHTQPEGKAADSGCGGNPIIMEFGADSGPEGSGGAK